MKADYIAAEAIPSPVPAPGETLLTRMWETVFEKGIGALLRPRQMLREGRATLQLERERTLVLADAQRAADEIRAGQARLLRGESGELRVKRVGADREDVGRAPIHLLVEEVQAAVTADSVRREVNVAKALLQAAAELESDASTPPSGTPEDDWLYRWRDAASAVSSEYLQQLWGKVLAGEFRRPGSVSLRTVDFLRNLSQEEAHTIETLAPFVIEDFVYGDWRLLEQHGMKFRVWVKMEELGLLHGVNPPLRYERRTGVDGQYLAGLRAAHLALLLRHPDPTRVCEFLVMKVTPIGVEVLSLGVRSVNVPYLQAVGREICRLGFDVALADGCSVTEDNRLQWEEEEAICAPPPPPAPH